jgi:DNA-binding NarL/FixJ family response regulator
MKSARILIADDHEVVRAGVRILLESESGWKIVGEAATGREAVALAQELKPDVVVLDIGMPELNGLDAARQIKQALPETEIAIFSAVESEQVVHEVFAAGARAYLLKSDAGKHLVAAVKALLDHKPFLGSKVSEIVFETYLQGGARPEDERSAQTRLTPREREIVQLLCEGHSSKEVAARLGISARTAETHRANVMSKLGLKSFSELVRYAIRNKIVEA